MIRVITLCNNFIETLSLQGCLNLTSLDLSGNNIKELNDIQFLNECRGLKKLFLDDNKLSSVNDFPSTLEKLTTLSLRNNCISLLKLPKLASLEHLNLTNNKISRV